METDWLKFLQKLDTHSSSWDDAHTAIVQKLGGGQGNLSLLACQDVIQCILGARAATDRLPQEFLWFVTQLPSSIAFNPDDNPLLNVPLPQHSIHSLLLGLHIKCQSLMVEPEETPSDLQGMGIEELDVEQFQQLGAEEGEQDPEIGATFHQEGIYDYGNYLKQISALLQSDPSAAESLSQILSQWMSPRSRAFLLADVVEHWPTHDLGRAMVSALAPFDEQLAASNDVSLNLALAAEGGSSEQIEIINQYLPKTVSSRIDETLRVFSDFVQGPVTQALQSVDQQITHSLRLYMFQTQMRTGTTFVPFMNRQQLERFIGLAQKSGCDLDPQIEASFIRDGLDPSLPAAIRQRKI